MAVAWLLLLGDNALNNDAFHSLHLCDMPGPSSPLFAVLLAINAPLAVPRALWEAISFALWGSRTHLPYWWSVAVLVAAVGLIWYWAALNLQALRKRGTVLMFSWRPVRFSTDTLLIAVGLVFGLFGASSARGFTSDLQSDLRGLSCYGPVWLYALSDAIMASALFVWSFALVLFFGRDFIHCVRGRTAARFRSPVVSPSWHSRPRRPPDGR